MKGWIKMLLIALVAVYFSKEIIGLLAKIPFVGNLFASKAAKDQQAASK